MKRECHWMLLALLLPLGGCKKAADTQLPPTPSPVAMNQASQAQAKIRLEQRVKQILVDELGIEEKSVIPQARIMEDLGADSLDAVELIMRFEEEFQVEISDEEAKTRFPNGWKALKPYLRIVPQPKS